MRMSCWKLNSVSAEGMRPPVKKCRPSQLSLPAGLKGVHERAVREDVHEELPSRPQPARDPAHQNLVVAQVLEHLHRDAAVVPSGRQRQGVHVAGDHGHVGKAARQALRLDVSALTRGIGYGGDASVRVTLRHPKRERPPPATELQDLLIVAELCTLGVERQHRLLGCGQRLIAARVVACRSTSAADRGRARKTLAAARSAARWPLRYVWRSDFH